jgi:hypothetical protein
MIPRVVLLTLAVTASLVSGCHYPLKGYTWKEWHALSAAERRRLVDERYPSNPEMHRALQEDARNLSGSSR